MPKKPKPEPDKTPFTSFRVIGERAQKLLERARKIRTAEGEARTGSPLPPASDVPEVRVELQIGSVVKAALAVSLVALGLVLLWLLLDKLILLALAVFLATIIDPGVEALRRMGVPRGLGVILHYFVAIFLVLFLLLSLIPIIAQQIQQIAVVLSTQANAFISNPQLNLPLVGPEVNLRLTALVQSTLQELSITKFTDALATFGQNLNTAAQGSFRLAAQVAGGVLSFFGKAVVVFVLAFFMQVEKVKLLNWLRGFVGTQYRGYVEDKGELIHYKLGQWARGQLILCAAIGTLVFIALTILGMPYALTLAILAGFTEFIPVVGPFIAAVPSVLIGVTQNGILWGLVIALVYYVIQWCENNLLVPLIMKRAVGLSPIAILFAMLVAISFPTVIHPILGVILSIPTTTIIALFLEDLREMRLRKRGG